MEDATPIRQLQSALRAARFDAEHVAEAIHADGPNLTPSPNQVPVVLRALADASPLSTLIRLFVAGVPVPTDEVAAALGPLDLDTAAGINLLRCDGDHVIASVRLVPVGPLLLAYDVMPDPSRLPDDVVMGVSATSWALANLTVRRPVGTALDVGTGCGIQALFAARHAGRVTATDTNVRALGFAAFNAALNDLTNIEFVEGDLFEPVAGERFDLVVANPPFVISPDNQFRYRDGGWPRDELSRHVVQGAAEVVQPGRLAHILVSWVQDPERDWWEPVAPWVDGLGCDAWLFHFGSEEAEDYTLNWNQPLAPDPERHAAAVNRWLDYFAAQDIRAIAYGAVVLRRRSGATWIRAHSAGSHPVGPAGDQVWQMFAAGDYLDAIESPAALLGERFVVDDDHRLEQVLRLRDGGFHVEHALLHLDRGLPASAAVDAYIAHLLTLLTPDRTLGRAFEEAADAFHIDDRDDLALATLELIEHMVELGFVHPL